MKTLNLTKHEIQYCLTLIAKLKQQYSSATDESFIENAPFHATALPARIKKVLKSLQQDYQHQGIVVLKGFPIDNVQKTPKNWNYEGSETPRFDLDFFAVLLSSVVGEVFGWATQQKGKLIHDLIPIEGKEEAQTGYGSESELILHTEDSFHPNKADFVCMYAIRNDDKVGTKFSSIRDVSIPEGVVDVLFKNPYQIAPDESHLDSDQSVQAELDEAADASTQQVGAVQLLHGNKDAPYLCYDPAYTLTSSFSDEMLDAYDFIQHEVENNAFSVALEPGDLVIIDNHLVVHGREPFKPRFDGTDRWLKRINITADLAHSASERTSLDDRLVGEV